MSWVKAFGIVVSLFLLIKFGGMSGFWMWLGGILFWLYIIDNDNAHKEKFEKHIEE